MHVQLCRKRQQGDWRKERELLGLGQGTTEDMADSFRTFLQFLLLCRADSSFSGLQRLVLRPSVFMSGLQLCICVSNQQIMACLLPRDFVWIAKAYKGVKLV